MACFEFVAPSPEDPFDPGVPIFFPHAIHPDGDLVYGQSFDGVAVYTWPGLTFVSNPYATTGSVILDDDGNVYHQNATSAVQFGYYKNGSLLATISDAANIAGGGLAWAGGFLWTTVSSDAGTDSGSLYRIHPSTGAVTTMHSVTGGTFPNPLYAATDGAIWYAGQGGLSGTVYRHLGGSTTSTSLPVLGQFIPRPGGVMLARRTSAPIEWVDIAPDLSSGIPSCDPTVAAGATPPPSWTFANPSLTDVGFVDAVNDIYRAAQVPLRRFWLGKVGFRA